MKSITGKKLLIFAITVFPTILMAGCANMDRAAKDRSDYLYYHKPLPEASRTLEEARMAGKDRQCPVEYNAAKDQLDKAYEVYKACHTQEAIDMAQDAMDKIRALCPAQTAAKPKAAVILAAEPMVEEKVKAAAAEPKVIVLAFEDVHFDFDKSTLKPEAQEILKQNIQLLMDNPKAQIRIAGYTSASGTKAYNQKLSERRAKAVQEYLISEGIISRNRLSTIGYGETRPATYEAAPKKIYSEAAKSNMRVLFEIIVEKKEQGSGRVY